MPRPDSAAFRFQSPFDDSEYVQLVSFLLYMPAFHPSALSLRGENWEACRSLGRDLFDSLFSPSSFSFTWVLMDRLSRKRFGPTYKGEPECQVGMFFDELET